jgi:mttA/Hcf106 family
MPEIGIAGLVVILIVALLVFGPKRLPEMGRSLHPNVAFTFISARPSKLDREMGARLQALPSGSTCPPSRMSVWPVT